MTRERAAEFELEALRERAERIVTGLQGQGLPVTHFQVWDDLGKVQFVFNLSGGRQWSFMCPRGLLNEEAVGKMLRAYL